MKKLSYFLWLLTLVFSLHAQTVQNQNKKTLPAFDILQVNGSHFKVADLKKGQSVMVVYFDPDCDHCLLFTEELLRQINTFNNVQIVMITYVPIESVNSFITRVGLAKYPGIKVGTEGNAFVVRYHYNIMQFPYLALHDKNGILFATYESEVPAPKELAEMFAKK
jgi:hypothetical protein